MKRGNVFAKALTLLFVICMVALSGCGDEKRADDGKLDVVASFYPMAEFSRQIGGDLVHVKTMVSDGVEPHDWEPTAKDLSLLSKADVFVYNGGVESWAEQAIRSVDNKKMAVVKAGEGLIEVGPHPDPHVWVSPLKAAGEVKVIADAFSKKDPAHSEIYQKNADAYIKKLMKLDADLHEVAKASKRKAFITTHAAFGYLAKDYGLKQIPAMGINPESEPAPADLTKLVQLIKKEKIPYVFSETLLSPKVSQTIAKSSGAGVLTLNPVAGLTPEEKKNKEDYISIMEKNIVNLKKALN